MKFLIIATLLVSQLACADVLVLKNGDRITGDIKRIWDDEVSIEPEYSDEFDVDLAVVERIESERQLEIELKDGRELVGLLSGLDADGNQTISTESETVAVPLAEFYELVEPEEDFEWESNVDLSAALNEGNTESFNTRLRADSTVRFSDHRHIGEITFYREELIGVQTQEQDLFQYDYNWMFRDPWFFSTKLSYERNPIIELEKRVILSLGVGRDIWDSPRRRLSVQLGVGAQSEELGIESEHNEVLTWSLRYEQDFFKGDLELYHNHSITENLSGRDNTSFKSTTGLRYEITDLLYGNLSVDYDYESDPVEPAVSEDLALLVGLGMEF